MNRADFNLVVLILTVLFIGIVVGFRYLDKR